MNLPLMFSPVLSQFSLLKTISITVIKIHRDIGSPCLTSHFMGIDGPIEQVSLYL